MSDHLRAAAAEIARNTTIGYNAAYLWLKQAENLCKDADFAANALKISLMEAKSAGFDAPESPYDVIPRLQSQRRDGQ